MSITFACPHCQRTINAPDSAGGSCAKCPGCTETLQIPLQLEEVEEDIVNLEEVNQPADDFGLAAGGEDDPFADLGPATATPSFSQPLVGSAGTSYQAPATAPTQQSKRQAPQYSTLELVTAISAIVHGLLVSGPILAITGPFIFFALFSLTGLLLVAYIAASVTVLVCGVALLLKQDWAVPVGAIAGGVYFALLALSLIIGFVTMLSLGIGMLGLTFFAWTLPRTAIACVGPAMLMYMQQEQS